MCDLGPLVRFHCPRIRKLGLQMELLEQYRLDFAVRQDPCRASRQLFHVPLACINLASSAAVASGGIQPILIKAEGSPTSEPDRRS